MSTVVFVGAGRITSAMLAGLRLLKSKHCFVIHDRNLTGLRETGRRYAVAIEADLKKAVARADMLIIAVRPGSVRELLAAIELVQRPLLGISLAAGVPLRVLKKLLGPPVRWARAMPSPVCRSGRGLTAVTFSEGLPSQDRKRTRDLFASFGPVVEIPESRFDAFTVVYSCSHGYHALATLAKAGQAAGLDRQTALVAASHALADGIVAWREGERSLEWLLKEATTPGGISAATIKGMDAAGYGRAVRTGVRAGLARARANARK